MRAERGDEITIYTHPLTNFWLLALGGMVSLLTAAQNSRVRQLLSHGATLFALSVCLVGFCATEPTWSEWHDPLLYTLANALYGACIAALVGSIACCRNTAVIGMLETRWLVAFGRISYGFYLYHNLIPDLTRNHHAVAFFRGEVPLWAHGAGIVASFLLSLTLAILSWRFIEAPIHRLKSRTPDSKAIEAEKTVALATSPAATKTHGTATRAARTLGEDHTASDTA
jgi:peptidoglycan/LPS O-acetylase OafA/YrhL